MVGDLIKGKSIARARLELSYLPKRAALPILKLLNSAVSNFDNSPSTDSKEVTKVEDLVVKSVRVDGGQVLKRMMPRAIGRGFPIKKRTSHIVVELGARSNSKRKVQSAKLKNNKLVPNN